MKISTPAAVAVQSIVVDMAPIRTGQMANVYYHVELFLMANSCRLILLLFLLSTVAGCSEESGTVASENEFQAYVAEHGEHVSDPGPSPLTDAK